jgi:hypothetical protein
MAMFHGSGNKPVVFQLWISSAMFLKQHYCWNNSAQSCIMYSASLQLQCGYAYERWDDYNRGIASYLYLGSTYPAS